MNTGAAPCVGDALSPISKATWRPWGRAESPGHKPEPVASACKSPTSMWGTRAESFWAVSILAPNTTRRSTGPGSRPLPSGPHFPKLHRTCHTLSLKRCPWSWDSRSSFFPEVSPGFLPASLRISKACPRPSLHSRFCCRDHSTSHAVSLKGRSPPGAQAYDSGCWAFEASPAAPATFSHLLGREREPT